MKILLVEDDDTIRAAVRRGLEAEGWAVEVAATGPDGLWMATEGDWDLIVLDVMLPGLSGYSICAALRRGGDWTPILMLTAKDGDLDEADGLDIGADDWLTKPFSFPVLLARVRALVRRGPAGTPAGPLTVGDLRVDRVARRVWRADVEVELTARQFDLLAWLAQHAGQVVSKQQILSGVWPFDYDGDPNIVEVYVRRLRQRIDEPFGRHAIQTVRGVGYRLASGGG